VVLRRSNQTPQFSQRALAKDLGVGFGAINFCFQAMVEKGLVKCRTSARARTSCAMPEIQGRGDWRTSDLFELQNIIHRALLARLSIVTRSCGSMATSIH
jgi:hypothetical protein